MRAAELAEAQRLEEAERRRQEEKQARLKQEQQRVARETEVAVKVAARGFSSRFVADVVDEVFDDLYSNGFFYNPVVKAVETEVLPWLLQGLQSSVRTASAAQTLLQSFVAAVPAAQAARDAASRGAEAAIQAEKDIIVAEVRGVCARGSPPPPPPLPPPRHFVRRLQLRRRQLKMRQQKRRQQKRRQQQRRPRKVAKRRLPLRASRAAQQQDHVWADIVERNAREKRWFALHALAPKGKWLVFRVHCSVKTA
jgi:hypothetical protein